MKKVFYYGMMILMLVSFISFIYVMINVGIEEAFYLMFMSIITGLMTMMAEPNATKEQQNKLFGMLLMVMALIIAIIMMMISRY
jgi:hypothetical protein